MKDFSKYVGALEASHKADQVISVRCLRNLPNKDKVIEIIHDLRTLLFPYYFENRTMNSDTEEYIIGDLMLKVYYKLKKQLKLAFLYEYNRTVCDKETEQEENMAEENAENACQTLFEKLPEIYTTLSTDIQAAFDGDPAAENKDQIVFSYPCLLAISVHRIAHVFYELNVPLIPRMMSEYAHSETGIDIHPGAKIGKYFFIDHGTGVVIGETTEIGEHVKIYQGVTLGALSTRDGQLLRKTKRHPTIKDNVTIYSGVSVLGGETVIGENVVIGGNAFITSSVPSGTRVSVRNPELRFQSGKDTGLE